MYVCMYVCMYSKVNAYHMIFQLLVRHNYIYIYNDRHHKIV